MATDPDDTHWTVLRAASGGDPEARSLFARNYAGPIRAYLRHRWRGRPTASHIEDAIQDAFVECYKPGGVIERADPARGDFRALLYAVVRNVARRYEERQAKSLQRLPQDSVHLDDLPHQAEALTRAFDRAWAHALLREAVERQEAEAATRGAEAHRRFRILRMRHDEGLPVRTIAAVLNEPDVAKVHTEYRRARREFAAHLRAVVAERTGVREADVDAECRRLPELLGS